jgi:carboxyl-terminal processing protease
MAQGFGDYPDGFSPSIASVDRGTSATLPGCAVGDDFARALGDTSEALLAAALSLRLNPAMCPPAMPTRGSLQHWKRALGRTDGIEVRSPLRQNLLLCRS